MALNWINTEHQNWTEIEQSTGSTTHFCVLHASIELEPTPAGALISSYKSTNYHHVETFINMKEKKKHLIFLYPILLLQLR